MKKVILSTALVAALAFTSCKKEETKAEPETTTTETTTTETTMPENTNVAEDVNEAVASVATPKMSNPDAQKFVDEYASFVKEQIEVAKSGDATKMQELTKKATDWAKKTQEFAAKLTPEDQKLWAEYATKVAQEVANAAQVK